VRERRGSKESKNSGILHERFGEKHISKGTFAKKKKQSKKILKENNYIKCGRVKRKEMGTK